MDQNATARIRRFNRAVTLRTGALDASYLGRGRPLGQARLLFEIGPDGTDLRTLRQRLGLDSGYLARLVGSLKRQGLVSVGIDAADRRRRSIALTAKGRSERAAYDDLSEDLARSMLQPLSPSQRNRMVEAMSVVERLLTAASVEIGIEAPDGADARQCLTAYVRELAERFEEGFDPSNGNPTPDDAALTPPHGCFLVARLDGRAVGCGALRTLEPGTGEIKRMWVAPEARGLGVAGRILASLEDQARQFGMTRVRLDTNRALAQAQSMYRRAGYREIARFNDNPYADFWFEKELGPG
jgi:DNA-binding MarR family transcriptional regulator